VRRELEQVFLRPRAGRFEALLVIERETGARERSTLQLPDATPDDAVRTLGRQLARTGVALRARGVRLRVERGGGLHDDPRLAARLAEAYLEERRREREGAP
jgi:hypothetical protein